MPSPTHFAFYLTAFCAVLVTGISKGGFGAGLGMLGVPVMALVMPPVQAAGILLPVLCLMDLTGFKAYFRQWDVKSLRIMLPGAFLGIALGTVGFSWLDERWIRLIIGAISIAFVAIDAIALVKAAAPEPPSVKKGLLWSCIAGFTSFVAHAGGPPVMIYLLPQRMKKEVLIATTNVFFMIVNATKLVPYLWLGQLGGSNLRTSLLLAPLAPFGVWLGIWMQRRLDTRLFYRISNGCLLAAGLQLIVEALL